MSATGKYIYGITASNGLSAWDGIGAIPYQDISAVVSDSEIIDYTQMPKDALARLLLRHQEVIERIMPQQTVIPVRLGTFAVDETEAKCILNKGYDLIKDILEKVDGKIEIDLVASWNDFTAVLKEVGEEEEIKEFKARLLAKPKEITADDQMKVGIMVKDHLDKKRAKYALEVQTALSEISPTFKAHDLMDDKMIANLAFLIDKTRSQDFAGKVEELNVKFAGKLDFRCVGPLPAYSFYTLEVKRLRLDEIDWAKKKLGLGPDFTSKDEIKKAYQRAALSAHPDRNPDAPGSGQEFAELTRAYKMLIDCCQAGEPADQPADPEGNLILVRLRQ